MIRLARFAVAVALAPPVALVTAWFGWINTVNNAKAAANAQQRLHERPCGASTHWDDQTCPRCDPGDPHMLTRDEARTALGYDDHPPLSWELARTPEVCAMSLRVRAAFLATARDIDRLPVFRGAL